MKNDFFSIYVWQVDGEKDYKKKILVGDTSHSTREENKTIWCAFTIKPWFSEFLWRHPRHNELVIGPASCRGCCCSYTCGCETYDYEYVARSPTYTSTYWWSVFPRARSSSILPGSKIAVLVTICKQRLVTAVFVASASMKLAKIAIKSASTFISVKTPRQSLMAFLCVCVCVIHMVHIFMHCKYDESFKEKSGLFATLISWDSCNEND